MTSFKMQIEKKNPQIIQNVFTFRMSWVWEFMCA